MIILASASPRRKELLTKIIPNFKICPSEIKEEIPNNISALDSAQYLAVKKAMEIHTKYPNDTIIGADTVIVLNNKIYGKPKNKSDAKNMLLEFSGKKHHVITGVCIINKEKSISFSSINEVEFYELEDKEIDAYLTLDEYKDKAGSYAIQGQANLFIKKINGDYNSIIGLPISQIYQLLKKF